MNRLEAWELLREYNKDKFHLQHALTVEGVMKWFAENTDSEEKYDSEFWGIAGLLHDIDFEQYPDEHCLKAPQLLRQAGADEALIHAVVSHGYGIAADVEPSHFMEKILFATDELTGLIWASAIIRPTKSVQDLEVKSVRKKYKTPSFAAGCSREVIQRGAKMLGWDLDVLIGKTILAMRSCETFVRAEIEKLV
ncbi:MAG: hydrolase [Treponema sp.]|jgi:predicted hydrolase (HD superfamily)|nr:hydrolase [Treponema sp.]